MLSLLASWVRKPLEAVGVVSPDYNILTEEERELMKFLQKELRDEKPVYKEHKGFVTQLCSNSIELDHKFIYELGTNDRFGIGDRVAYKVFKLVGESVVKDVTLLVEKNKLITKKVSAVIVKVEGSSYELSNRATFDLKKVRAEFLPILNDRVTLEGDYPKDRDDEFDMDFSLFNIIRVSPAKSKLITGSITEWSPESLTGVIGKEVCFHQNVCDKFSPKMGDMVLCNAIEGRYDNGFKWRAETVGLNTSDRPVQSHYKLVVAHVPSFNVVVGESKTLELCLSNLSKMMLTIKDVSATANGSNAVPQLEIKEQAPVILPGSFITWSVEVFGSKIGNTKVWLKWNVDCGRSKFITKSSISYVVVPQNVVGESDSSGMERGAPMEPRKVPHFIPGQARVRNPVFRRVPLKEFGVPHFIRTLCDSEEENRELIEVQILLQREYPSLAEGLNMKNYGEWMHTMLFLEEVSDERSYKKLDTQAHLYTSRQCIVFNFPIDSEYSKIVSGDSILVTKPWDSSLRFEGKIWETSATQLFCKFNPDFEQTIRSGALYDIVFKLNRSAYRRRHQAVDLVLEKIGGEWLFPAVSPDENLDESEEADDFDLGVFTTINKSVNQEQIRAVKNILTKKNLPYPYIIYGPPGTGKTLTVIELILQVYTRVPDCRILVAAPTNSAVDTLGVRLLGFGVLKKEDMVRLTGFNAYSQGQIATQLMDVSFIPNLGDPSSDSFVPFDRDPPPTIYANDIGKHKITIGTLSTLAILNNAGLPQGFFTHIVIDEAGQCHEPESLLPVSLVNPQKTQLVLAGDPMQLGPTITSMLARQYHFHRSLLDRFSSSYVYRKKYDAFERTSGYNPRLITRLIYNYRSLPKIVNLVGELYYENDLLPIISGNKSPEADILRTLEINGYKLSTGMNSLVFINVDSKDEQIDGSHSWYNSGEVLQVMYALNSLYAKGISPDDIGVITPYSLQVRKIYELLDSLKIFSPKVASVEEFQGQERNVIIISLVRNNLGLTKKLTTFLTDAQRINVALSRARILSVIIGNRKTLSLHPMWANIISRCHVMNFVNVSENDETS